jgi:hypothetical protein
MAENVICPICKSEAEAINVGLFDGVGFRCKTHGEFEVADSALAMHKDTVQNLGREIRECYRRAEECGRLAEAALIESTKADYLDMERRWRSLAHSYEFCRTGVGFHHDGIQRAQAREANLRIGISLSRSSR